MRVLKESSKGTYVLILWLEKPARIRIGKLGVVEFKEGFYSYIGSAFGPGGLAGRIGRHLKKQKHYHWHIDYLRRKSRLTSVWHTVSPKRREHDWAFVLAETNGALIPMLGFGSSDCSCPSHLVYFKKVPAISEFRKKVGIKFPDDPIVQYEIVNYRRPLNGNFSAGKANYRSRKRATYEPKQRTQSNSGIFRMQPLRGRLQA